MYIAFPQDKELHFATLDEELDSTQKSSTVEYIMLSDAHAERYKVLIKALGKYGEDDHAVDGAFGQTMGFSRIPVYTLQREPIKYNG